MEWTSTSWIISSCFAHESLVLELCAEELSGDVDGFASNDNHFLAIEELLGHDTGETTKEMAFAVDDDLYLC